MKLTSRQIKFCEEYVKNGLNGTQAYMKAYKNCKKEETATASASRLLRNVKVLSYIEELQEELKDKAIMSAKERMVWLSEVVNDIQKEGVKVKTPDREFILGEGNADLNTKMKAIDILNKMSGEYKTILDGNVGIVKLEDVL